MADVEDRTGPHGAEAPPVGKTFDHLAAARKLRSAVRRSNFGTDADQRMIQTIAGTPSYAWSLDRYIGPDLRLKHRAERHMFRLWFEAYGEAPYPEEHDGNDDGECGGPE